MTSCAISLHDFQAGAVKLAGEALRRVRKVVLQMPTGSGKTMIAAFMILRMLDIGKRVLFICDREELIEQTSRTFDRHGIPHGVIQGNHERWEPWQPVQVATAQTLARRTWPHADLIIVDEAHTMYQAVLEKMRSWDAVPFVGLTATPYTPGMSRHWDELVVGATTRQLIDAGHLCPYIVYGPPPPDLSNVSVHAGDYNQAQLSEVVRSGTLVGQVVQNWLSLGEERQTICFAVDVAHSKSLVAKFREHGVAAAHIDAHTDSQERRDTLRAFAEGEIRIVSSVDILTKGYDQPQASCLIQARPTKSLCVFIQQCGRVLRVADGKQNAIILDHGGNTVRHGFPCDPLPTEFSKRKRKVSKGCNEKADPKPKACGKCNFVKPAGTHECPNCGFAPERQTDVTETDDHLVRLQELEREQERWYAMLLHHAEQKGYGTGWAAHRVHDKFGVWPRKRNLCPIEPDQEVQRYLKYLRIRKAKSNKCFTCNSTETYTAPGRGPHAGQLRCKGCDKHIKWLTKAESAA